MNLLNAFDLASRDENALIGLEAEMVRASVSNQFEAQSNIKAIRETLAYVRRQRSFRPR